MTCVVPNVSVPTPQSYSCYNNGRASTHPPPCAFNLYAAWGHRLGGCTGQPSRRRQPDPFSTHRQQCTLWRGRLPKSVPKSRSRADPGHDIDGAPARRLSHRWQSRSTCANCLWTGRLSLALPAFVAHSGQSGAGDAGTTRGTVVTIERATCGFGLYRGWTAQPARAVVAQW